MGAARRLDRIRVPGFQGGCRSTTLRISDPTPPVLPVRIDSSVPPKIKIAVSSAVLRLARGVAFLFHRVIRFVKGLWAFADRMVRSFEHSFLGVARMRRFAVCVARVELVRGLSRRLNQRAHSCDEPPDLPYRFPQASRAPPDDRDSTGAPIPMGSSKSG